MNYTPAKEFFDLTNRPGSLNKRDHLRIQGIQMELADMQRNADYLKRHNPIQWEKAKEMSAGLQEVIFRHWDHNELLGR